MTGWWTILSFIENLQIIHKIDKCTCIENLKQSYRQENMRPKKGELFVLFFNIYILRVF